MRGLFPGTPSQPSDSTNRGPLTASVTTRRLGTINPIPIDYGFRPRLRGRLTLRGLALRRNPWTYGGSVSHTPCRYSCQHSHFRYLQSPSRDLLHRPTERSATAPESEIRDQGSELPAPDPTTCASARQAHAASWRSPWYSSRQRCQVGSSMWPRSKQYRASRPASRPHEPIAIVRESA